MPLSAADAPRMKTLRLYRYCLPMKQNFGHAAATRAVNEGLFVQIELADGAIGMGEGIPRPYVTGETINSAIEIIRDVYVDQLRSNEPLAAGPLPGSALGVWHNAAWGACELAFLDAWARSTSLPLAQMLSQRLQRPLLTDVKSRVGGVLGGNDPAGLDRKIRHMRWFGLRDFKLKVGLTDDAENLEIVYTRLRKDLQRRKITLRADANGAWSNQQAERNCRRLHELQFAAIEQPLRKGNEADLPELRRRIQLPIILDESLVDYQSADRLARNHAADYWNIRITKNGGLLQSIKLADLARQHGIGIMLGALVGESGILSAAARVFLQLVPDVIFLENSYGSFLLETDLVCEKTRFGYAGRLKPLRGAGLGVTLDEGVLSQCATLVAEYHV